MALTYESTGLRLETLDFYYFNKELYRLQCPLSEVVEFCGFPNYGQVPTGVLCVVAAELTLQLDLFSSGLVEAHVRVNRFDNTLEFIVVPTLTPALRGTRFVSPRCYERAIERDIDVADTQFIDQNGQVFENQIFPSNYGERIVIPVADLALGDFFEIEQSTEWQNLLANGPLIGGVPIVLSWYIVQPSTTVQPILLDDSEVAAGPALANPLVGTAMVQRGMPIGKAADALDHRIYTPIGHPNRSWIYNPTGGAGAWSGVIVLVGRFTP